MKAIFACGCFWGVQHHFRRQPGVLDTVVGYTGGTEDSPTYKQVKAHATHHVEAIEVSYDPTVVTYKALCQLFFELHDPAQTDGIGPDLGPQYRSVIFPLNDDQRQVAQSVIDDLRSRGYVVNTELRPAVTFWPAEDYHQDYFEKNGVVDFCHVRERKF